MPKVSPQQREVIGHTEQSKYSASDSTSVTKLAEAGKLANEWMNKYCGDKTLNPSVRVYKKWDFYVNKDLNCDYKEVSQKPGFIDTLEITCYPIKDNLRTQCNFSERTHIDQNGNISSAYTYGVSYYKTEASKEYQSNGNESQNGDIPFSTRRQIMEFATKTLKEKCKSNPNYRMPVVKSRVAPALDTVPSRTVPPARAKALE